MLPTPRPVNTIFPHQYWLDGGIKQSSFIQPMLEGNKIESYVGYSIQVINIVYSAFFTCRDVSRLTLSYSRVQKTAVHGVAKGWYPVQLKYVPCIKLRFYWFLNEYWAALISVFLYVLRVQHYWLHLCVRACARVCFRLDVYIMNLSVNPELKLVDCGYTRKLLLCVEVSPLYKYIVLSAKWPLC